MIVADFSHTIHFSPRYSTILILESLLLIYAHLILYFIMPSMMNNVCIIETEIPKAIYDALKAQGIQREQLAEECKQLLALHFFDKRILSLGQAARLSGMGYWSFTEYLSMNNVPVVDLDDEELAKEFATVDRINRRLNECHSSGQLE